MSHCYDSGYDSDAYDSDESPEEMKNNKWYFVFFTKLDKHTVEEINDPERVWRCPACQNGTGAVRKFKGLKSLVDHAKKVCRRMRIHRDFAKLLEQDERVLVVPAGN
ncbi:XS domain-containing protein [Artemisia annua]|uniref:XS domain-containing protein n=1 Tax=Artemisia annua TaxID=35608 RepID=A0A2U1NLR9_ARTAN|nr:XS domain-containing protein [Artemisia annua]